MHRIRVFSPTMTLLLVGLGSCATPVADLGICGNGVHEPDFGEECDDGAGNGDAAACSMTCRVAACGDGLVQPDLGEACDLGDQNSNDGACTLACKAARCGDGFVQPGELCDDGDDNRSPDGAPGFDGTPFGGDGEDCEGWTKTDGGIGSYVGVNTYDDGFWTHFDAKLDTRAQTFDAH